MSTLSYYHRIRLDDFRDSQITEGFPVAESSLGDGQIMAKVDKLALTSNSVSYVIAGNTGVMPFLDLYPAPAGRAHIPCWGYADVVHSKDPQVTEGERLYGFFPVASHVILTPGKHTPSGFTDVRDGRDVVAPFYSEYSYARQEPGYAPAFEDHVMLFRPLFGTSYLLQSFCEDNAFFDADRIIVTSASAKTAMGFGYLLRTSSGKRVKAIGLTSQRNRAFVEGLDCFDDVLTYDDIDSLEDGGKVAFFDIAGNKGVADSVHRRLGSAIVYSGIVGQTHWDDSARNGNEGGASFPGARPVFWSGPDQVMALRERHGAKGMARLIQAAMVDFLTAAYGWIEMTPAAGADAVDRKIQSMLDGDINANEGVVLKP